MNFSKSIIIFEKQNIEYMEDIFSEALEKAHTREGILGSISESKQDFLEKGKRAQVGEIREWKGQKFQKQPNGGWLPVKGEKKSEKSVKEKSEEKKDTHGIEKKVLDFLAVSNNKYNDISKVSIYKTPKGNWALQYEGKDVSTVNGSSLPEADLKAAGLLEEEEETETKKGETKPTASSFFGDIMKEVGWNSNEYKIDREGDKYINIRFTTEKRPTSNDLVKTLEAIEKTIKDKNLRLDMAPFGDFTGKNPYIYIQLHNKNAFAEEKFEKKEEIEMPSEKDFFRATGLKYNHPVEDYQVSLAILNEVPDDHKMWTGKTAGEMKELLTKQITKLGGSIDVGTMKDWFIDE